MISRVVSACIILYEDEEKHPAVTRRVPWPMPQRNWSKWRAKGKKNGPAFVVADPGVGGVLAA
ncbi:MAG: hypothetical protein WAN12_19355 [Candidatus Acidiferrum sp.]